VTGVSVASSLDAVDAAADSCLSALLFEGLQSAGKLRPSVIAGRFVSMPSFSAISIMRCRLMVLLRCRFAHFTSVSRHSAWLNFRMSAPVRAGIARQWTPEGAH
jgi:hypothetical protein